VTATAMPYSMHPVAVREPVVYYCPACNTPQQHRYAVGQMEVLTCRNERCRVPWVPRTQHVEERP
jgi:hypothetical protein